MVDTGAPSAAPQSPPQAGRAPTTPEGGARVGGETRYLRTVLISTLVLVSLIYLLRPIAESDFFWHLKTGEWIVEHRRLPPSDPFSYPGQDIATQGSRFTLTSYWACQVLFFAVHALGGFKGVVLLRLLFAATLFTVAWKRLRGNGVTDAALLLVFAVALLEAHGMERPQVLSFICFGALLQVLDNVRGTASGRGALSAALLMLFWANVHGGFVLGQATIVFYLAMEGAKFAHRSLRPMGRDAYRSLLLAGSAGLVASLANPNTYHALELFFPGEGAEGQRTLIAEYLSSVAMVKQYQEYTVVVVWVLMLLTILAIARGLKEIDITEAFLVVGCAYFAVKHVRYIPFFTIAALPLLGRLLSQWGRVRWVRFSVAIMALALALGFAWDERNGLWRLRTDEWVDRSDYPVEAADFVLASGLRGNMYNFYNWGGYLIWRLAPERKVFVDGRNINPGMHWQASIIRLGFEQGQNSWKQLLDHYGITYILIPVTYQGMRVPLVERLATNPDWVLLFSKSNSAVFARRSTLQ